ncbi:pentatricopeptide repeat-containing protein At5g46100-like [Triticum dicoccoides]|uniref:pentatricopeptide repeat-containing protein At5g46100-like n=1 Tax=Triticum dicoccoides TaxID=85692 RepID=UPI000E7D1071|nr:pentatricopeptide repeat-containing protein At5g46100-like [Triticum dicoccoides]XP_044340852.1 pentatricopeptide repeat-containing protein At5g46100-like [Triticum aestivum]
MPPANLTPIKWPKNLTAEHLHRLVRAERDPRRALALFDAATAAPVSTSAPTQILPSPDTVSLLTSRLASAGLLPLATSLLSRSRALFPSNADLEPPFLTLLRAFSRTRRPLDALQLFRSAPSALSLPHSARSYTAVLAGLVAHSHLPLAHSLLADMRAAGFGPTIATYNVLLKAHCSDADAPIDDAVRLFRNIPKPDACSYNTLIDGLCRRSRRAEAQELFSEMVENGVAPTVVTYTTIINWLAREGCLDDALEMFDEMGRRGIAPNVVTYCSLIDGLSKGGRAASALDLLERLAKEVKPPNTIIYSSVINGLCKEGLLREAMEVLDRMRLQGRKPDAGLFGKLIVGLCDAGRAVEAANYLDEMVLAGVQPNRVTWSLHVRINVAVVTALCVKGEVGRAFQVYQSMRTRGISTEPSTFHLLVEFFCKKNHLEKAARVVLDMLSERCIPERETWDVIVSGYWSKKKVRQEAEQIWDQLAVI